VKADPHLVGQSGDPLRAQHRRQRAKHAWQAPGRYHGHPIHDHLAPGHLGAVDGHDRHHQNLRVDQNLGGPVGLEVHRAQRGGERVAAMPQPPRPIELEAAAICLESITNTPPGPITR